LCLNNWGGKDMKFCRLWGCLYHVQQAEKGRGALVLKQHDRISLYLPEKTYLTQGRESRIFFWGGKHYIWRSVLTRGKTPRKDDLIFLNLRRGKITTRKGIALKKKDRIAESSIQNPPY